MAYIHQINEMDFENSFQECGYRNDNQTKLRVGAVVSVFVNFCSFHCKGCWNEKTWNRQEKLYMEDEDVANNIIKALNTFDLEPELGLSLLGGDPLLLQNADSTAKIIELVLKEKPNTVIGLWTGYKFEYLLKQMTKSQEYILNNIDVLIDGQFILKKEISNRRYGSSNQRVINVPQSIKDKKTVLTESFLKEST